MELIKMTDFVLEQNKIGMEIQSLTYQQSDRARRFRLISKYAKFLKTPLTLGMFVPCDEDGNVLNDPGLIPSYELEQYRKAKEKVLFKGFENFEFKVYDKYIKITDKESLNSECFSTVEHLIDNHLIKNIHLTESAIKQIGL